MAGFVVLDTPKPESRPEIIGALRLAIEYATIAKVKRISIQFEFDEGKPVTVTSDE